nr:Tat pathway signal protein [Actinomyces sp.]
MKPAPVHRSPVLTRSARGCLALLLAGSLLAGTGACELRLGHGAPDTLPTASATEAERDALARQATLISSTAQALLASGRQEVATQVSQLIEASELQLQALGGVWRPWPASAPTTLPTTTPVATAPADATPDDLLQALVQGAEQARQAALQAEQTSQAQLYAALTASWSVSASQLAATLASTETDLDGAPRQASQMTQALDPDLLQAYDAARYAMEEVAARSADAQRTQAQAEAAYADDVVNASVALGGTDSRLPAYAAPTQAPDSATSADTTWARQSWTRVCEQEIVSLAALGPAERETAIDAAVDAAHRAVAWGASTPALPGYEA